MRRLDRSLLLLGVGLLIGASLGFVFFWLEDSGRIIFGNLQSPLLSSDPPRVGTAAPDFELLDLKGKAIRLSHLKGQPVFINFWATWCPPCRAELPLIEEARRDFPNLIILAIDADEDNAIVQAFVEKYDFGFDVLLDPGAAVNDRYYVQGLPTSYFIDSEGVIQSIEVGLLSAESLAAHLAKIGISK